MNAKTTTPTPQQQSVIDNVTKQLAKYQSSFDKMQVELNNNFIGQFGWVIEDMLLDQLHIKRLTHMLYFFNEEPGRIQEWLEYNVEYSTRSIMQGGFVGRSTSRASNMVHELEKEETVQNIAYFKQLLAIIKLK